MGLKFTGEIPFRHVFINGLVRDFRRRKMSKSEGNIIDPLLMIDKYGTDALRFTMAALAIPGMDLSLSEERMAGYRAFVNKIWNASRFVLMNLDARVPEVRESELTLADRWVRSRLAEITAELEAALEEYKFYEAAEKVYHFVWHEFCDWYIEMAKPGLQSGIGTTRAVLAGALDHILRLLHPFMPFVTEEIWSHLPVHGKSLALAPFPRSDAGAVDARAGAEMRLLRELVVEVRTIRAENRVPNPQKVEVWLKAPGAAEREFIPEIRHYILALANGSDLRLVDEFPPERGFLKGVAGSWEVAIPTEGLAGLEAERARLEKEIKKAGEEIGKVEARLQNKDFLERAPRAVIDENQHNAVALREKKAKLEASLALLKG
jgi:valyl-tRNA synthetase